eukprot:2364357-Pyramimonas_sp.AAC.1
MVSLFDNRASSPRRHGGGRRRQRGLCEMYKWELVAFVIILIVMGDPPQFAIVRFALISVQRWAGGYVLDLSTCAALYIAGALSISTCHFRMIAFSPRYLKSVMVSYGKWSMLTFRVRMRQNDLKFGCCRVVCVFKQAAMVSYMRIMSMSQNP